MHYDVSIIDDNYPLSRRTLVRRPLMKPLVKLLAIRLTKQETLGESLVIATRPGCITAAAKSLVIPKGEATYAPSPRGEGWGEGLQSWRNHLSFILAISIIEDFCCCYCLRFLSLFNGGECASRIAFIRMYARTTYRCYSVTFAGRKNIS